jgi:hypothetical protein
MLSPHSHIHVQQARGGGLFILEDFPTPRLTLLNLKSVIRHEPTLLATEARR